MSAVGAVPASKSAVSERARDAMSYTIRVDDGGRNTILNQSDTTMSLDFAALLEWLEKHFASK